jgi:hypothetical protein
MNRRATMWMLCIVAVIAWTGAAYAQTTNLGAMKTMKLPSGEEVYDLSGEWDVMVENYGHWERFGSYPQVFKITQEGKSFTGVRLKDNPYPALGSAGSKCAQGEVDKSGIKKLELIAGGGDLLSTKLQISEDGNRISIDAPEHARQTWTRKSD